MIEWKWLGIDPTTDAQEIRKAYAEQAKKYHPEEHPEEFKALQKAYKDALRYARQHDTEESSVNEETIQETAQTQSRVIREKPQKPTWIFNEHLFTDNLSVQILERKAATYMECIHLIISSDLITHEIGSYQWLFESTQYWIMLKQPRVWFMIGEYLEEIPKLEDYIRAYMKKKAEEYINQQVVLDYLADILQVEEADTQQLEIQISQTEHNRIFTQMAEEVTADNLICSAKELELARIKLISDHFGASRAKGNNWGYNRLNELCQEMRWQGALTGVMWIVILIASMFYYM